MGGTDHFGPVQVLQNAHEGLRSSRANWRVALNYHFTPDILTYGSIATGFKSGDFNGSFLSNVPVEIARQLKPVLPESVMAYEVGVKSSFFERRLIVDAAAFYNQYDNQQVFVLINPPPGDISAFPVNVLDNARAAHTEGIEAQITARPVRRFTASVELGWLEARLDDYTSVRATCSPDYSGNQQPNSPHFSMSATADYKLPLAGGAVDFQFNATYKSHQFFDTTNDPYITQGGYWIENARVAYGLDGGKWEVAAFARNLANAHYFLDKFDLTSPFGFIQGIMGTPRFVGGEINYRF
jgi:iron complex outermembrane receptor protein